MACHNICTDVEAPAGIEHLLGLEGKYCEKKTKLNKKTLDIMFRRLRTNIKWKYVLFRDKDDNEDNYIPDLHINTDLKPDAASEEIERSIDKFEKRVQTQRTKNSPEVDILKSYSYATRIVKIHAQEGYV